MRCWIPESVKEYGQVGGKALSAMKLCISGGFITLRQETQRVAARTAKVERARRLWSIFRLRTKLNPRSLRGPCVA